MFFNGFLWFFMVFYGISPFSLFWIWAPIEPRFGIRRFQGLRGFGTHDMTETPKNIYRNNKLSMDIDGLSVHNEVIKKP